MGPSDQRHEGRYQRWNFIALQELADDNAVETQRKRSDHHGAAFQGGIGRTLIQKSDCEGREGHRRGGPKQPGEALRAKDVAQHGKGG